MISELIHVVIAFIGASVLAALFAGSETGMYQVSPLRIRLGLQAGHLPYKALNRLMHDRALLLFSMLIGTNLTQYLATSIVTHAFLNHPDTAAAAEVLTTAITAPLLFIFSELIPKNVFYYRADILMPLVANVLYLFHKCFTYCGLVPLLRSLSHLIAKWVGLETSARSPSSASQRHRMDAIIRDTHEEGLLTHIQIDIIGRIIGNPPIRVRSVMSPYAKAACIDQNSQIRDLLPCLNKNDQDCCLVKDPATEQCTGYINVYEALTQDNHDSPIKPFIKPILMLQSDMPVIEAITQMRSGSNPIALVTKKDTVKRPTGFITLNSLIDEVLLRTT